MSTGGGIAGAKAPGAKAPGAEAPGWNDGKTAEAVSDAAVSDEHQLPERSASPPPGIHTALWRGAKETGSPVGTAPFHVRRPRMAVEVRAPQCIGNESAKADFACFQRRIHSLLEWDAP